MIPLFQLSTRSYDKEIIFVKNAMTELEKQCNVTDGFTLSTPFTKAGWTIFNLQITTEMETIIEKSGMMEGASGHKIGEQLKNYLGHFLQLRGSQARIKQVNY